VVGEGLVVEGGHLAVPGRPVEGDRLDERAVGLQPQRPDAGGAGVLLDRAEQPPSHPEAADGVGHPHPLDLRRLLPVQLERGTAHGLAVQPGQEQQPRRRNELVVHGRKAAAGVEAALEAAGELGEVRGDAGPRVRVAGVGRADVDHRRSQQSVHLGHRGDQPALLRPPEPGEHRGGRLVGAGVQLGTLPDAGPRQPGHADPPVNGAGPHRDEPLGLQRPEHPAQVPRVQVEPGPQRPHIGALRADLPQHSGVAERPAPGEERVLQGADPLGDRPVEPADLGHRLVVHPLTVVRGRWDQCGIVPPRRS
jgi:hypothetical protein